MVIIIITSAITTTATRNSMMKTVRTTYSICICHFQRIVYRFLSISDTLFLFLHDHQQWRRRRRESAKLTTPHLTITPIQLYPPSDKQCDALYDPPSPSSPQLPPSSTTNPPPSSFHPAYAHITRRAPSPAPRHAPDHLLPRLALLLPTVIRRKWGRRSGAHEDDWDQEEY